MIRKVIDDPKERNCKDCMMKGRWKARLTILLIIVHSVSRVNAKNISARLSSGPVEIPVIIGGHLNPSTLLKIIQQNWLIHVRTKADFHSLVLIVCDPEIAIYNDSKTVKTFCKEIFTFHTSLTDLLESHVCYYHVPS